MTFKGSAVSLYVYVLVVVTPLMELLNNEGSIGWLRSSIKGRRQNWQETRGKGITLGYKGNHQPRRGGGERRENYYYSGNTENYVAVGGGGGSERMVDRFTRNSRILT